MATSGPVVDHKYMKDIEGARKDLRALVHTNNAAPILLRLAFHDAANYNAFNNTGGVNGSVRLRQELNQLPNNEGVKKKHPRITYADLFQLAGIVAVQESGGPTIDFVPGRADTNVPDQLNIPNPNGGAEHLRKIFYKMGLIDTDIVALSGAHTLGRARRQNSGFDGPFTRNPLKFDNSYFVELLKGDTPGLVKFPTDKALLQDPVFRPLVELYARDKGAFFSHYAESHKKLSELGFANNSPWCIEQDRCAEFTNNCEFTSNCELPNNYEFNSNCCEQQYKYCGAY